MKDEECGFILIFFYFTLSLTLYPFSFHLNSYLCCAFHTYTQYVKAN